MSEIPPNAATVAALPAQAQAAQEPVPEAGADFASLLASALAGGADPATGASPQETLAIQTQAAREDAGESGGGATPSATDATGAELAALSAAASLVAALITGPDAAATHEGGEASADPTALEPAGSPVLSAAPRFAAPAAPEVAARTAPQVADPSARAKEVAPLQAAPAPALPARVADPVRTPSAEQEPVTAPDPEHAQAGVAPSHRIATFDAAPAATAPAPAFAGPSPVSVNAPADAGSAYAPLRPGAAGFAEAFCARVQLEIAAGRAAASIEVNPPELGPVELRIHVADGTAHVACSAPHAAAREAIAQALPLLRDMLAAQGLALGETSVGAELPARDGSGRSGAGDGTGGARETASAPALAGIAVPASPRRGLVDVFA